MSIFSKMFSSKKAKEEHLRKLAKPGSPAK